MSAHSEVYFKNLEGDHLMKMRPIANGAIALLEKSLSDGACAAGLMLREAVERADLGVIATYKDAAAGSDTFRNARLFALAALALVIDEEDVDENASARCLIEQYEEWLLEVGARAKELAALTQAEVQAQ